MSPVAIFHFLFSDNFLHFVPPKKELNNLLNTKMNNLEAIDYQNKDWSTNHDSLIPRYSQEFPRFSESYKTKFDLDQKPWGPYSEPIFFDC